MAWVPVPKARERNALKRDEFVKRVQEIGELGSREEAERAIDESQAIRHARAVALVLQGAVTTGEMDDVRHQLKDEYAELFGRQGE